MLLAFFVDFFEDGLHLYLGLLKTIFQLSNQVLFGLYLVHQISLLNVGAVEIFLQFIRQLGQSLDFLLLLQLSLRHLGFLFGPRLDPR